MSNNTEYSIVKYIIVEGSVTGHCCFKYSVIAKYKSDGRESKYSVCECFDKEDAEKIVEALNKAL